MKKKSSKGKRNERFSESQGKGGDKTVKLGHGMGGLFGSVTPKKPQYDKPAPTRAVQKMQRAARMKRLDKKII